MAAAAVTMHRPHNRQAYENLLVLLLEQNDSDNEVDINLGFLSHSDQQEAKQSLFSILANRAIADAGTAPMITYTPSVSCLELNICDMTSEDDLVSDTGSFALLLQYLRTNPQLRSFAS
jgi:hypothetical protein